MSEKPEDTLHAIASRASELVSQVAALQKHAEFTSSLDRDWIAAARAALTLAVLQLQIAERQARAAGEGK